MLWPFYTEHRRSDVILRSLRAATNNIFKIYADVEWREDFFISFRQFRGKTCGKIHGLGKFCGLSANFSERIMWKFQIGNEKNWILLTTQMEESIASADVRKEIVAQALAFCGSLHQTSNIDDIQESWNFAAMKSERRKKIEDANRVTRC